MNVVFNRCRLVCADPKPGMGATVFYWSDRSAATVTRVSPSGKTAWIRMDRATRTDNNGLSESQTYTYASGNGPEIMVRRRRDGQWKSSQGQKVAFGDRSTYVDPSF